jgi:hypothetical protein
MFERFTDRARRVVVLAQEEARLLDHNYIGTEHILLGLTHQDPGGVAARALEALGVSLDTARGRVEEVIGRGKKAPKGHIPFTPRAKKVLELSLREALQLGHNYIGTEHILLGLVREGEGVAAQVLVELGADLSRVRQQVIRILASDPSAARLEQSEATLGSMYVQGQGPGPLLGTGAVPEGVTPELRQVIALGPDSAVDLPGGARLTLLSVEIWSHWLELRYALTGTPAEGTSRPALLPGWTLTDNEDRTYRSTTCTANESALLSFGAHRYAPPPPETATRLVFAAPDDGPSVEIPLGPPDDGAAAEAAQG